MEIRPGSTPATAPRAGRGSGAGARKRRSDALGPRKDIIIRLPEAVQDFCEQAIVPEIRKAMAKHGLTAEQLAR
jgi:hypothetical protein